MTIRNWGRLYFATLLIGGIVTIITGFVVRWQEYASLFQSFKVFEILMNALWFIGVGFIFATLSHMGFFAYLMVHRIGLGFFRTLWNPVQIVLIAFVLFDLVYFRYVAFAQEGDSVVPYILIALFLFLIGVVFAYMKAQNAGKAAFIPALFFMVVITILEWVPVLRINEEAWLHLMLYPLLLCNAYQLLSLPKYLERSKNERLTMQRKKEAEAKV